jgi:hypothetical protein
MLSDLTALAKRASQSVVAVGSADDTSTDEWGTARRGFAGLLGRGDTDKTEAAGRRLDQTRDQLQAASGHELKQARADLEVVWQARLEDLLDEDPDVAGALRSLVDHIEAKQPQKAGKHAQWRDALQPIPRILSWYKDNAVAGILLAAGFVVFKGYVLARGDVATALGILQYAGLATVVTAGLLSSLPILITAMLAYTLSRVLAWFLAWARWKWGSQWPQPEDFSRPLLWVTLGVFVLAAVFAPWTYLVLAGLIGLAIAVMRPLRKSDRVARPGAEQVASPGAEQVASPGAEQVGRLFGGLIRVVLGAAAVVAVIFSLYAVWVPHEVVYFRPGTVPPKVVGYVLSEGGGWITILTTGAHRIVHYPDADVAAQMVCEKTSELTDAPTLWDTATGLNPSVKSVLHPVAPRPCPH